MIDDAFWAVQAAKLAGVLRPLAQEAALYGSTIGMEMLGGAVQINWDLVNARVLARVDQMVFRTANKITDTTAATLREAWKGWIAEGKPLNELVDSVSYLFDDGRAEEIAVTETTRLFAEGNLDAWSESGVVEGKQWGTGEDELVCPICAPLGQLDPVPLEAAFEGEEGSYDMPPAHPSCRCYLRPVMAL